MRAPLQGLPELSTRRIADQELLAELLADAWERKAPARLLRGPLG